MAIINADVRLYESQTEEWEDARDRIKSYVVPGQSPI